MVEAVDCGSWVLYIFSSWFVVDKAPSRALGLGAKHRYLPKWIFFNISAAQQYSPFFYIIFHHPDFFTPTASSSDLVFSREDSSVDGSGSHYQLFSLTTTRVRQRCRETQNYTTQHNHIERCFFRCCRNGKNSTFEVDNIHLVTTFAGGNFLDRIAQCNYYMDVVFLVFLWSCSKHKHLQKKLKKEVGSTMKGGASPWLFSHSISSFEYKVASTTCHDIKKYFLYEH